MSDQRNRSSFLITFVVAAMSLVFMAPAAISEVFSWIPKRVLAPISSASFLWKFIGLCEIAVAIGDRFYLFLALILYIFLLLRRQVPVWLKVLVWVLFAVAVLGAVRMETEIRHFNR
jgi:hypothetical protein